MSNGDGGYMDSERVIQREGGEKSDGKREEVKREAEIENEREKKKERERDR